MSKRLVLTTPILVRFVALEIDSIHALDPTTGTVHGTYSLLRMDGTRIRSVAFTVVAPGVVDTLMNALLMRILLQSDNFDGNQASLAGTIVDAAPGSPVT